MGDWAYLRKSDTELEARSEVTAAPVLLRAKYYVPNLFPALFAQEDFATPSRRSWFQTPLSEAVRRLRRLGTHAAGDSCLAVFWEACIPVAA